MTVEQYEGLMSVMIQTNSSIDNCVAVICGLFIGVCFLVFLDAMGAIK